jgi:hypothetical protein
MKLMTDTQYHRGIGYCIEQLRVGRWKWEIVPPESVKGLYAENGEVDGGKRHAVMAAYEAIDHQTIKSMGRGVRRQMETEVNHGTSPCELAEVAF